MDISSINKLGVYTEVTSFYGPSLFMYMGYVHASFDSFWYDHYKYRHGAMHSMVSQTANDYWSVVSDSYSILTLCRAY